MHNEIYEASFDEDKIFFLYGKYPSLEGAPSHVNLPALIELLPNERLEFEDGRFQLFFDPRLVDDRRREDAFLGLTGTPITGRLSPTAPRGPADRTVTARADVVAALLEREKPVALIVTSRLPTDPTAAFLPVANVAAALRQAGRKVVVLHFGAREAFDRSVAGLLRFADVAHHISPPLAPTPDTVWDSPFAVRATREALAAVFELEQPETVLYAEPWGRALGLELGAVPEVLLDRGALLAPFAIAAPIARAKLAARISTALTGVTAWVESADLLPALRSLAPEAQPRVLPAGGCVKALTSRARRLVVSLGSAAWDALPAEFAGPRVALAKDAAFKSVMDAMEQARAVVALSDAGAASVFAARVAECLGVPIATDLDRERLDLPLAALPFDRAPVIKVVYPPRAADAFPTETPRPFDPLEALRAMLLQTALVHTDPFGGGLTGLLLSPDPSLRPLLLEVAAASGGRIVPLVEDAPTAADRSAGCRMLSEAARLGLDTVLVGEFDKLRALRAMARANACGLVATPLFPQGSPSDQRAVAALMGVKRHATVYVGRRPPQVDADLFFLVGPDPHPADALELSHAGDERRGRLWTLFRADAWRFLKRPAAPAIGVELARGQSAFGRLAPSAGSHEVMIALALHLGCRALVLEEDFRSTPAFRACADAFALTQDQVVWTASANDRGVKRGSPALDLAG